MNFRKLIAIMVLVITVLSLGSCIPGDGRNTLEQPAGFFWGVWHGWVAPVSLIISLFDKNISVYERSNNGFWYDLGFYMAIVSGFGGLGLARGRSSRRPCRDDDE